MLRDQEKPPQPASFGETTENTVGRAAAQDVAGGRDCRGVPGEAAPALHHTPHMTASTWEHLTPGTPMSPRSKTGQTTNQHIRHEGWNAYHFSKILLKSDTYNEETNSRLSSS